MTEKWGHTLIAIPGYDPYRGAEDYYFDAEAAQLAIDFFPECLTHVKGEWAGQPLKLERWEKAIIGNLFGWKHKKTHLRRYRKCLLYVPRKNAKTTLAGGIVVYTMFCDGEPGAEIYSAAAEREQASLVFVAVREMILAEPTLRERAKIYQKAITLADGITHYKPISADANTKHGFNAHLVVVDELHAQPNAELVEVLETSMGSRRQPLIVYLTTADFKRESICNRTLDYAEKVRDGILDDPQFLPVIYQATTDDNWRSEDTWRKANPNYGISVKPEYIKAACRKAVDSPEFENTFKRLHLNIQTETDVKWLNIERWDDCDEIVPEAMLAGRECFAGLDLSTNTDIAGYGLLFPWDDDMLVWLPRFFIPMDNAYARERRDRVPYPTWANSGYITMTPGDVVDYGFIRDRLAKDYEKFAIREIAFDRWNFEALRQQLVEDGIDENRLIAYGQGYASMSAPTKELEKRVLAKKLIHNGNPVMRWMASNTVVEQDAAGNVKPTKAKSAEKIDGVIMLVMAMGRLITQPPEKVSVYESRGMLSL